MKKYWVLLVLLMATALVGCASPQPSDAGQEPDQMNAQAPTPTSSVVEVLPLATSTPNSDAQPPVALTDPALNALIAKATDDLAQRFSIPSDQVKLQEALEVTWPDSSLGCPNPAAQYLMVQTPGYLLRFQAMERTFEYHTDKTSNVIFCENSSLAPPGSLPDK